MLEPANGAANGAADGLNSGGLALAASGAIVSSHQAGPSGSASPERALSEARPAAQAAPAGQVASAAQAAPAAQVAPVLVSLSRSTGANGDGKLTLRLEPVELGRVQIQIERSHQAAAKVDITVDRRETLTLLLRDQHDLQRALDQAGVPAAGRTLSFHFAGQDQPASGNNASNDGNSAPRGWWSPGRSSWRRSWSPCFAERRRMQSRQGQP